jgi:galactokinase
MDFIKILTEFKNRFGKDPLLFRSPARINIIGEHTDYNDGFVMPAAIDREIIFAIAANNLGKARVLAHDLGETDEFEINSTIAHPKKTWSNYLRGVLNGLKMKGIQLEGFDMVFGGNIPPGAGLSSSAALEGGIGIALKGLFKFEIPLMELAKIGQKAEHEYVGVKCGLMDQFANLFGQKDRVMKFDCRSLDFEYLPFKTDKYSILLCDSKVKHALASSEYNTRRGECETGVSVIRKEMPEISKLRDISPEIVRSFKNMLDPIVYKRCLYVCEENLRVEKAAHALRNNDFNMLGELMQQSHQGLSLDYEVSCRELDILAQLAAENPHIAGARMMGGGFGGCTINLLESAYLEEYISYIKQGYRLQTGSEPEFYIVSTADGAGPIEL